MKHSTDRILTTHAGSLSRPANLIALSKSIAIGEAKADDSAYAQVLAASVADVVSKQRALGVDIPDDGEFGKPVAGSYDYGAWWNYAFARRRVSRTRSRLLPQAVKTPLGSASGKRRKMRKHTTETPIRK